MLFVNYIVAKICLFGVNVYLRPQHVGNEPLYFENDYVQGNVSCNFVASCSGSDKRNWYLLHIDLFHFRILCEYFLVYIFIMLLYVH